MKLFLLTLVNCAAVVLAGILYESSIAKPASHVSCASAQHPCHNYHVVVTFGAKLS